jgi:hypothetical protein
MAAFTKAELPDTALTLPRAIVWAFVCLTRMYPLSKSTESDEYAHPLSYSLETIKSKISGTTFVIVRGSFELDTQAYSNGTKKFWEWVSLRDTGVNIPVDLKATV